MKIAIMGTGGIGGYYGGMLAAAGNDVGFIARGAHLQAIRENGLRVTGPRGDIHVTPCNASDDPADIGPADVVLFCVKLYDTETASELCRPLIGPDSVIITVQNGVDSAERLAVAHGADRVMAGIAYVAGTVEAPGLIRYRSEMNSIVYGESGGGSSERALRFQAACEATGFRAVISNDIETALWTKFVLLCSNSSLSSLSRRNVAHVYADAELRALAIDAMREVIAVAAARGVHLDDSVIDDVLAMSDGYPPDMTTSMHNDLKRDNRLELEHLAGALARMADNLRVPVPITRACYAALKPYANGAS